MQVLDRSIKVMLSHPDAILPSYGSEYAAGLDLHSLYDHRIYKGEITTVRTGVHIGMNAGQFGVLTLRSSAGLKGLYLANTIGIIDSDYTGELLLKVGLHNWSHRYITAGDRIAQLVIQEYVRCPSLKLVTELDKTERGNGGFGSTGR